MNPIRRHDLSPRVEMLPLIDVVFLLLTFFIYAMLVLFPATALRIAIQPVSGQGPATREAMHVITIRADRQVLLDDKPTVQEELFRQIGEFAELDPQPAVYVLLEADGQVDRAPLLIELAAYASKAGIDKFRIVGPAGRDQTQTP